MRTPIIAGNWKLFKKSSEAVDLVTNLAPLVKSVGGVEIIVAPVFTVLATVKQAISGSTIKLAHKTVSGKWKVPSPEKYLRHARRRRV